MKPAAVGHVQIKTKNSAAGKKLLQETRAWLEDSRWKDSVSLSLETEAKQSSVEFLPGEFQSNGPRKINLAEKAQFTDFCEYLRKWLWELEDGPDFTIVGGFGENIFYL